MSVTRSDRSKKKCTPGKVYKKKDCNGKDCYYLCEKNSSGEPKLKRISKDAADKIKMKKRGGGRVAIQFIRPRMPYMQRRVPASECMYEGLTPRQCNQQLSCKWDSRNSLCKPRFHDSRGVPVDVPGAMGPYGVSSDDMYRLYRVKQALANQFLKKKARVGLDDIKAQLNSATKLVNKYAQEAEASKKAMMQLAEAVASATSLAVSSGLSADEIRAITNKTVHQMGKVVRSPFNTNRELLAALNKRRIGLIRHQVAGIPRGIRVGLLRAM